MSPRVSAEYKEQKRKKIVDAAKGVFCKKGYELTSMEDIIQSVGMSKGGVYHYFSGKEEIFETILAERPSSIPIEPQSGESILETIKQALSKISSELQTNQDDFLVVVLEYYMSSYRNESRRVSLLQKYINGAEMWEQLIATGVERGEFRPLVPAKAIAYSIVSFIEGIAHFAYQVGPEKLAIHEQFDALLHYLECSLVGKMENR